MTSHALLQTYFEKRKAQHSYSLRALARDCGVSPSFMSRVLSGKKALPLELFEKIAKTLDVEPETLEAFRDSFKHDVPADSTAKVRKTKAVAAPAADWQLASKKEFSVLRNWFYVAILDFVSLKDFDGTERMISERLELAPQTVEVAVRELVEAKLLKIDGDRIRKSKTKLRFASKKNLEEIRSFHDQMMQQAQRRLREDKSQTDFERRLITGITITASRAGVEKAKAKLAACLHEIADDLMNDEGEDVYQLAAQLFPLTKPSK